MSRYSEREVERALEKMEECLGPGSCEGVQVLFAGHRAEVVDEEFVDGDGNPAEPDPEANLQIVIRSRVVETGWSADA